MKNYRILIILALFGLLLINVFAKDPFTAQVTGLGSPVILIPGLSCSGEVWNDTVAHYKDHHECHVLTLAGFAGVLANEGEVTAPVTEAIAGYIQTHKLNKPVIVGHSLGGFIALRLGASHPELVGSLVIVDAYPFLAGVRQPGSTSESAAAAAKQMRDYLAAIPDEAFQSSLKAGTFTRSLVIGEAEHARIVAWGLASDRRTANQAMFEIMSTDLRPDLARITAPTLVMGSWISYRPFVDHARIELLLRDQYSLLSGVQIAISDTARHFIMLDDPVWFFKQLDTVL